MFIILRCLLKGEVCTFSAVTFEVSFLGVFTLLPVSVIYQLKARKRM